MQTIEPEDDIVNNLRKSYALDYLSLNHHPKILKQLFIIMETRYPNYQ